MPKNTPSKQEKLEMLSYGFRSCTSYKWVATFRMILKISTIHKALSTAYGDKKTLSAVLLDMLRLIWKHRAWIDAYNNPEFFIEDYFVERLYLKNRDVNDYPMLYEGIRAMAYASIPSNKKLHEINDKETCWEYMTKKGFPMPARLGHLYPSDNSLIWKTPNNEAKTLQDLLNLHPHVFIKPADGMQGQNCYRLSAGLRDGYYQLNGNSVTAKELLLHVTGELLIEEVVINHKDIAALYPKSLNTVRIITLRPSGEKCKIFKAFLRIGAGDMTVDNYNKGGIGVMIDEKSGKLQGAGITQDYTHAPYTHHPDSGILFDSLQLPY